MWFIPFTFRDFIDILLVATIMYWIFRSTKGTNAPYILSGVIVMYFLWVVVKGFNMELLSSILGQIMAVGAIALIVIFQPEIRRFLQLIRFRKRHSRFIERLFGGKKGSKMTTVYPVADAIVELSKSRVGGIVVLSQHSDLSLITEGGVEIDAKLSTALLLTLMGEKSPLRNGAVVIDSRRIIATGCILPITQSETPESYSVRQKAALGLSEISDAVIIVIDGFDGRISIINAGTIKEKIELDTFTSVLHEYIDVYNTDSEQIVKSEN